MYFQPYGNGQQLNLNWIINEIIELHKHLDPDYETPSFSQIYPYSNLNQLNLDWILSELKTLKELAPEPTPELDIQAVAEALVALPFDSTKSYQIYDFISKDGEIWRATEAIAAGGAWDETKWFKTKLGTDLAVLERWINAINASLTTLERTVDELSSADISDDSSAGGATVKASLNNLKGSLNSLTETTFGTITKEVSTGVLDFTTCVRTGNVVTVSGRIYSMTDNDGIARNYFLIPEGFRPNRTINSSAYIRAETSSSAAYPYTPITIPCIARIQPTGYVTIGIGSGFAISQVFFSTTYTI